MRGMRVRGMRCCVNARATWPPTRSKRQKKGGKKLVMHERYIFFNKQTLVPALARKGVEPNKKNPIVSFLMRKLASED